MLTMGKLDTFEHFGGDIDARARMRRDGGEPVSDDEWYLIEELLQRLGLVAGGFASPTFAAKIEQQLLGVTADEATRDRLRRMATRAAGP